MRAGVIHHASSVRPPKSLVVRAGLVRTFGGLAGFVVVTFLCGGLCILEHAFANPLEAGAAAVIGAAFIITLAAMLLFFPSNQGPERRAMPETLILRLLLRGLLKSGCRSRAPGQSTE
jgi:hypothetical protein